MDEALLRENIVSTVKTVSEFVQAVRSSASSKPVPAIVEIVLTERLTRE